MVTQLSDAWENLLPTRSNDGSYAYHELNEDGLPECGGGGTLDDEQWIRRPRVEAKARAKSHCGTCWWLTSESVDQESRGPDTA